MTHFEVGGEAYNLEDFNGSDIGQHKVEHDIDNRWQSQRRGRHNARIGLSDHPFGMPMLKHSHFKQCDAGEEDGQEDCEGHCDFAKVSRSAAALRRSYPQTHP